MTTPQPPTGVVIHTPDGPRPAGVSYVGVRKDGLHVWHADAVLPVGEPLSITVADLPAKTIVMLALKAPA